MEKHNDEMHNDVMNIDSGEFEARQNRIDMCHLFALLLNGHNTGKGNGKELPDCVVKTMRHFYHEATGKQKSFLLFLWCLLKI